MSFFPFSFWSPLGNYEKQSCLKELKFCEVSENLKSSICWKFQLSISKNGKSTILCIFVFPISYPLFQISEVFCRMQFNSWHLIRRRKCHRNKPTNDKNNTFWFNLVYVISYSWMFFNLKFFTCMTEFKRLAWTGITTASFD